MHTYHYLNISSSHATESICSLSHQIHSSHQLGTLCRDLVQNPHCNLSWPQLLPSNILKSDFHNLHPGEDSYQLDHCSVECLAPYLRYAQSHLTLTLIVGILEVSQIVNLQNLLHSQQEMIIDAALVKGSTFWSAILQYVACQKASAEIKVSRQNCGLNTTGVW